MTSHIVNSSPLSTGTLVIGALGVVAALATTISRRKEKSDDEKPAPLPCAPTGSKFVALPTLGVTLRYTDSKDGTIENSNDNSNDNRVTFLLLHGFAGVLETWELVTPHLLQCSKTNDKDLKVRVVALDLVGSGFSDKPTDFDYSYRNQGKVVSEFISVLGLKKVVLVGHSSGTVVGAATAVQQQQESSQESAVVASIFMACALFRHKSDFFSKSWLKPMFQWMTTKMMANRKQSMAKMHLPIHAERVLTDDFVEKFAVATRLPNFNSALVDTVMAKEAPYEELVDELLSPPSTANNTGPCPILFVWGKQDTYQPLPAQQKESLKQKLDSLTASTQQREQIVETKELDECHHYPQHEQPEALAKEILSFVQKNVKLQ